MLSRTVRWPTALLEATTIGQFDETSLGVLLAIGLLLLTALSGLGLGIVLWFRNRAGKRRRRARNQGNRTTNR